MLEGNITGKKIKTTCALHKKNPAAAETLKPQAFGPDHRNFKRKSWI